MTPAFEEPPYSSEEREQMLAQMREVCTRFYAEAMRVGNHPFIEFCGLMREYIKVCACAQKAGIDFTQASGHTGQGLPLRDYNAAYLAEKLACIYGPSLRTDAQVREAFIRVLFPDQYVSLFSRASAR